MARPSAKKKSSGRGKKEDDTIDVVDSLATRLAEMGRRKWKAKELAAALEKAAGSLTDVAVKAHIQANLEQCARQLHERLLALQTAADEPEETGKASKRSKGSKGRPPATAAAGAATAPQAGAVAPAPPTLATIAGYRQLVAAAAEGRPDARFPTSALLLSRMLPAEQLVAAHVAQLSPAFAPPAGGSEGASREQQQQQRAEGLIKSAAAGLRICTALSAEASNTEDALRMCAPAVALLRDAAELVAAQQPATEARPAAAGEAGAKPAASVAPLLQELTQLAARTLASMHAMLQRQAQQEQGSLRSQGTTPPCFWRSNPPPPAAAAAEAARSVAAAICTLRTTLRLHGAGSQAAWLAPGRQRQQVEALAAGAAADMRLLSPYAASGQLTYLANLPLEEAQASSTSARRYLALYSGAARHGIAGERDYLSRLAAARKAAAVARHLEEGAWAACILEDAAHLPSSQECVGWLHEQPPSGIVSAALDASQRGPNALSTHLVLECSERGLQALLAAMQRGGESAGGGGGSGGGGADVAAAATGAAEEQGDALDDLLFFTDKEGDATVFGRHWHTGSSDDEEEEEEEEEGRKSEGEEAEEGQQRGRRSRRGVRLSQLPVEGGWEAPVSEEDD